MGIFTRESGPMGAGRARESWQLRREAFAKASFRMTNSYMGSIQMHKAMNIETWNIQMSTP